MNISADTVEEYLAKAGGYESDLRSLDKLIRKIAPGLKPVLAGGMTGKMLGYGLMPYKPKSAKVATEWPLVALAAQKNYMALYVCALEDGQYIAEKHKDKLGKVSVGKSCIRFKRLDDLDLKTVTTIVKNLDKRYQAGEKLYGY